MIDTSLFMDIASITFFSLVGFSARLGKKFYREAVNPMDYLRVHHERTISSAITIIIAAITTYTFDSSAGAWTYVVMAYTADSLVNKTPTREEADLRRSLNLGK